MRTVVYHAEFDKTDVRRTVLREARVVLAAGGDAGTAEELSLAREAGLPIVALPTSGASLRHFNEFGPPRGVSAGQLQQIVALAHDELFEMTALWLSVLLEQLLALHSEGAPDDGHLGDAD